MILREDDHKRYIINTMIGFVISAVLLASVRHK